MREQAGLELLAFGELGFRQITNNVRPIVKPEDLNGVKLRVPGSKTRVLSFEGFGASPITMNFGELYLALQQGTVDGQENPIETIYAQKFYEVQEAIAMVDYIDKPAYVMISESFWSSLSDEDKALFKKAQAASRTVVEEMLPDQQKEFLAKMQANGITVTYPDKAEFMAATQSVRDKLGVGIWGEETYKKVVEIGKKDL